jgi:hypothetical protein
MSRSHQAAIFRRSLPGAIFLVSACVSISSHFIACPRCPSWIELSCAVLCTVGDIPGKCLTAKASMRMQMVLPRAMLDYLSLITRALPFALGALLFVAAVQKYRNYREWQADEAAAQAIRSEQLNTVRKRFASALEMDTGSQEWIPASSTHSVTDLTEPVLFQSSQEEQRLNRHPSASHSTSEASPMLPYYTTFPPSIQASECGTTLVVSFRSGHTRSNWFHTSAPVSEMSREMSPLEAEALAVMQARSSARDEGKSIRDTHLNVLPFEIEDTTLREFRRFSRRAKVDLVQPDNCWDISKLLNNRPIPKVHIEI